jgi:hypothetical protein
MRVALSLCVILSAGMVLTMQLPGLAKAAFLSKKNMIDQSSVIAVVDVSKLEATSTKSHSWTYRQKATASVERILKGTVPKTFNIYGDEDFICAQCKFPATGRYLVFLRKADDLLVGSNWQYSFRKIDNKQVDWLEEPGQARLSMTLENEDTVIKEVTQEVADQAKLATLPDYLKSLLTAPRLQDGQIGEAREPNPWFQAYEKAKKQGKRIEPELQLLLKNATPAGKMYAAFLLRSADPAEGQKAFESLKKDVSTFTYQSGCKSMESAIYQAADQVLTTNKFQNFPI